MTDVTIGLMNLADRRHSVYLMAICLLLAAGLRLFLLGSVPPGLHYDEAANGTLATGIGFLGDRPIFIASYTGKEVLFFYLVGGVMRLLGDSTFSLRLTAAFVGLLTVAVTYWLGCELFRNRRLSLVAAVLIGVSFWHLVFSRLGFRAISQPLLQALAVAALFRGLRRRNNGWLIGAGLLLGLTAYTYLAARLFPALLLLALLPVLVSGRSTRLRWGQVFLVGAVALAMLIPLIGYFSANPEAFWVRIRQVTSAANEPTLTLAQRYVKTLQMFFLVSDPHWRFNVPDRPLFDWFWGAMLLLGWMQHLFRWRTLKWDWQRAASLLVILAPFIMVLPAALVTEEIVANNMRVIGLAPFLFFLPARGLLVLLRLLQRPFRTNVVARAAPAAAVAVLAVAGFDTYRTYFHVWATQPALYYESDGDLTAVAKFLDEIPTDDAAVYVSALHYRHPTLAFLSSRFNDIKWLTNSEAVVFPALGPAIYVFPHNSPVPQWAKPFLETAERIPGSVGPGGRAAFDAYRMAETPQLEIPNAANDNFDNFVTLLGYQVDNGAAEASMPVTLYWRIADVPPYEVSTFVHLQDSWGYRWSHAEPFAYPVAEWETGEMIVQRVNLPVPAGTPPGNYRIRVGLFRADIGRSIARLDELGAYAGDATIIEAVAVEAGAPAETLPRPPFLIEQEVRPGLVLIGYERGGDQVATGESYFLTLWWHALTAQTLLITRLELVGVDGRSTTLTEMQPVHGTYPFQAWQAPQFLIDHVTPQIPIDLMPGRYRLRLELLEDDEDPLFATYLNSLVVESTERLYALPDVTFPVHATFGNEIELLGYDLAPLADPTRYDLALAWKAIVQPTDDYTVFVHLLDRDGRCCVWQQDIMPRQNQYPTSRWLANEVVIDSYEIELPESFVAGDYPIEVGLYLSESGKRLQALRVDEVASDHVLLQDLEIGK